MKILIVTLAMTRAGEGVYYNRQDIGLGRALAKLGHCVFLYNFVDRTAAYTPEVSDNLKIFYLQSRAVGQHSLHDYRFITPDADVVICFSDNQLGFGRLKRRCRRVGVPCLPYVGVIDSHSTNPFVKFCMDYLVSNRHQYKGMKVLAKTPQAAAGLKAIGAASVATVPVGLDGSLLHCDKAEACESAKLRRALGLADDSIVILFLARMTQEKRPFAMADIFEKLARKDCRYHLIVIGTGKLSEAFDEKLRQKNLTAAVTHLQKVPNSDIWQYYGAADVLVNLNTEEIFGMAILEAMYYGCPVAARRAPGPDYIIEDGVDGLLCEDDAAVASAVERLTTERTLRDEIVLQAKEKIRQHFLWDAAAERIIDESTSYFT